MGRFFGRRDVKVFLLLWIPVVWMWVLGVWADETYQRTMDQFVRPLMIFLGQVIGPGLVLLGIASGVERHRSIRHSGGSYRLGGEILTMGISFLAGMVIISAAIVAGWLGLPAWGLKSWLEQLYPPGAVYFDAYNLYQPTWKANSWIVAGWLGWMVGYRSGRRWGSFLRALPVVTLVAAGVGELVYRLTRLPSGGEWATEMKMANWYMGAFFADLCLFITGLIALDFLYRLRAKWSARLLYLRTVAFTLVIAFFFSYRTYSVHRIAPWPPPATQIVGLDPSTGRLWFSSVTQFLNLDLFALDYPAGPSEGHVRGPQVVYDIGTAELGHPAVSMYVPSAPAVLLWGPRRPEAARLVCRSERGIETIDSGPGGLSSDLLPVRCPGPVWYALSEPYYEVERTVDEKGNIHRDFRSRLVLFCPGTGESMTVITHPKALLKNIRRYWLGPGYQVWPGTEDFFVPPPVPQAVPVDLPESLSGAEIRGIISDAFLLTPGFDPKGLQVSAFLNHTRRPAESVLSFEVSKPFSSANVWKIPAPSGNRGCVWSGKTGTLEIYESGTMVVPVIRDATGDIPPLWSPDGRFLVHFSQPAGSGQSLLKLAFPSQRDLLQASRPSPPLGALGQPSISPSCLWSPESDWLAVWAPVLPPQPSQLIIFRVPEFTRKNLPGASHAFLHDGSLPYAKDGKIYVWRPGYDEPVCIYDPARRTVRR